MIELTELPTLNAALNATSAVLLTLGFLLIRLKRMTAHRNAMIAALVTSSLFLISYLIYHFNVGSKPYEGEGVIRTVYFTILLSHTVLAAVLAPLVIVTVARAWRADFQRHRRIARWTLPIWLYVSVTGVVIYLMLYVWM